MITRDLSAFVDAARGCAADFGSATARAAFLVAPDGFAHAADSARDNRYMADAGSYDANRALAQHRGLHRALSACLPTVCFAGDPAMPDAVFPNNVFATAPGRCLVARMRHPVRQREAGRADIRGFFTDVLGYALHDLSVQPHPCELTGSMVIDRARGLGFCGLSERCDEAGARLMHDAFGLRATLVFDLAPGEYHTNVVLAVLAGRAALVCADGFADPAVVEAIAGLYAPHALRLSAGARAAYAGNAIALGDGLVWMSVGAGHALGEESRQALRAAGFGLATVELDAIEAAGGSLRCCVGEIF
ncbi:arginine deiminase-related protein [Marilutibacter chinensis]|uniref:Arginine deiminase-related protein n=1 Tax=Marilutibacter chinensis TaxID=2912247 RepID=A0ABS9HSS5_9GAMM|nr:arginine deiminase-related protein [Lysobacter chinensis]MCF7221400.1 arginine deiminase-related protein [Lysobacter chinensis]